jgi:hypothetical protein
MRRTKPLPRSRLKACSRQSKECPGGCTVESTNIETEGGGYEADDVVCEDGQYDVYLSGDFKITNKVKEN